jgi:hypothetical protein
MRLLRRQFLQLVAFGALELVLVGAKSPTHAFQPSAYSRAFS